MTAADAAFVLGWFSVGVLIGVVALVIIGLSQR